MSLLAETMETLKYTEAQNKMILAQSLSNGQLAERFGKSVRQIQRQRAFLKQLEKDDDRSNPDKS